LLTRFCAGAKHRTNALRILVGRNGRVEQLNLLEPLKPNGNAAVWKTLYDKQRTAAIASLVRLIVRIVTGAHAEQEHKHE
jgi:ABC-type Fe3+ transport system substrate-binding protein